MGPDAMKKKPHKESIAFSINMEKESEHGLNFSQFGDIPGEKDHSADKR
jgi:hypothetical protein